MWCASHPASKATSGRSGRWPSTATDTRCRARIYRHVLQADGYAGFKDLYAAAGAEGPRVLEAACWAHVRRKFYDVHQSNGSPGAAEALRKIAELYVVEGRIWGRPA